MDCPQTVPTPTYDNSAIFDEKYTKIILKFYSYLDDNLLNNEIISYRLNYLDNLKISIATDLANTISLTSEYRLKHINTLLLNHAITFLQEKRKHSPKMQPALIFNEVISDTTDKCILDFCETFEKKYPEYKVSKQNVHLNFKKKVSEIKHLMLERFIKRIDTVNEDLEKFLSKVNEILENTNTKEIKLAKLTSIIMSSIDLYNM